MKQVLKGKRIPQTGLRIAMVLAAFFAAEVLFMACEQPTDSDEKTKTSGNSDVDPKIVGTWRRSDGATFEFNADGTGTCPAYNAGAAVPMSFTAKNSILTIHFLNRTMGCNYTISGTKLTLNGTTDYTKVS